MAANRASRVRRAARAYYLYQLTIRSKVMSERDLDSVAGVTEAIHELAMEQAKGVEAGEDYEAREVAIAALQGTLVNLRKSQSD